MTLYERFLHFITDNQLFIENERILLAVSGGRDSVLLAQLFAASPFAFGIAHCNFQLRGQAADEDEASVKSLAEKLDVPFYVAHFDTRKFAQERQLSIEMAARELRYNWFEKIRAEHHYQYIALAHHQNDTVETILFNLVRGTGIAGLHGILPKREKLVRPLLFLTRTEVDQAIADLNLPYRDDESNFSTAYTRNKIRLEVVPKLKEINPFLEKTFIENSKRFEELTLLVKNYTDTLRKQLFLERGSETYAIRIKELQQLSPLNTLLYELFKPFGFSADVLNDLQIVWKKADRSGKCFFSGSHQLTVDREVLILEKIPGQNLETVFLRPGETARFGDFNLSAKWAEGQNISKSKQLVTIAADNLIFPLQVRVWQAGDSFQPLGMRGTKKLSDFFIALKVPRSEKKRIPIVVNGNGDILWVAPYRMNDKYKITGKTKKVITLECI